MARVDAPIPALALPILRARDLEARDGTSTGSDYTEASPRPGPSVPDDPRSRAVPIVSSAQAIDLELVGVRAGAPGSGAIGYREPAEGNNDIRARMAANVVVDVSFPVLGTDGEEWEQLDAVTLPDQRVILTYRRSDDPDGARFTRTWNPSSWAWGDEVEVTTSAADGDCIGVLPSGRVLLLSGDTVYASDDAGETWSVAGDLDVDLEARSRVAFASDGSGLLVVDDLSGDLVQYGSSDGVTWTEVSTATGLGTRAKVVALVGGGFLVSYLRDADDAVCTRVVGSAYEPVGEAEEVEATAAGAALIDLVADPDGGFWLYAVPLLDVDRISAWRSLDGLSWDAIEPVAAGLATSGLAFSELVAAGSCGGVLLCHTWDGGLHEEARVACLHLGGWSSQVPSPFPSGDIPGTGSLATVWLPWELPGSADWTDTGSGAETIGATGELQIGDGTSGARAYERVITSVGGRVGAAFVIRMGSGGDFASSECGLALRMADGTDDREVFIRVSDAGCRVVDGNDTATTLGEVAADAVDHVVFAMLSEDGASGVWWRPVGSALWEEIWSGDLADLTNDTATPESDDRIEWGHKVASTSISYWRAVYYLGPIASGFGLRRVGAGALALSPQPIPLHPETGAADTGPAWLAHTAGTAYLQELWSAPARHDYPIEAIDPTTSPSPSSPWRSASVIPYPPESVLSWDLGERAWIGDAIAVLAHRVNFRIAALEYYDGASWVEVASLDLSTGFYGLTYDLTGRTVTPNASTAAGARWVAEGELAGGWLLITVEGDEDKGEPTSYSTGRRILWNSAGVWSGDPADGPQIRIELDPDGLTGGEDDTGGCGIVWPSGVLVYYPADAEIRRRWRLRIPEQECPDDWTEAGILSVFQVHALGAPTEWGWSRERAPNSETRRSRSGTSRTVRRGAAPRSYTAAWTYGVPEYGLRASDDDDPAVDYVAIDDDHLPLAGDGDVYRKLAALLERSGSGRDPVVWFPRLPDPGTGVDYVTVTDPELALYGRWTTSARADHLAGDELAPTDRVASITVEEITGA